MLLIVSLRLICDFAACLCAAAASWAGLLAEKAWGRWSWGTSADRSTRQIHTTISIHDFTLFQHSDFPN